MRCLFALLSFVATACAYQVLTPGNAAGWTSAGPNTVTWQRVATDPATFTMLLVNQVRTSLLTSPLLRIPLILLCLSQDQNVLPGGKEVLIATVDGTTGTVTVSPPSSGFPVGNGFQINFVQDPQDLNTILAQSQQFAITQSSTTAGASSTVASSGYVFF